MLGLLLLLSAAVMVCATLLVAFLDLHTLWMAGAAGVVLLAIGAVAFGVLPAYVVRLADDSYSVRRIRGAGVTQARWTEVEDAVTADVAGSPCVVLRLRDGRTTTIPTDVLAGDREAFVRDLQEHLQRGHGLRRLT